MVVVGLTATLVTATGTEAVPGVAVVPDVTAKLDGKAVLVFIACDIVMVIRRPVASMECVVVTPGAIAKAALGTENATMLETSMSIAVKAWRKR